MNYTAHTVLLSHFATLDSDGDGLPDFWSQQFFNHASGQSGDKSRASDDADGDGIDNRAEYIAGTSPKDAASALRTKVSASGNDLSITFSTAIRRTYAVEASALPGVTGNWVPAVTGIMGDGTVKTISLGSMSTPLPAAGFYRVSVSH